MIEPITINGRHIGDGYQCATIAEIGINHNGSIDLARQLIAVASQCGAWAVKFQKRTVDVVYSAEELARPRESPFGTTNGDLKRGLEFSPAQYAIIDTLCQEHGVPWFASCWDEKAVDDIAAFNPPAFKIASASLTDDNLLRHTRATGKPLILSTGMSTLAEIDHAVEVLGTQDLILLHCTSTYPAANEELNLLCIPKLRERYGVPVGYSGHEQGIATSVAAVCLGACLVERHLTLSRSMWGSDQAASLEPQGFARMVRDIEAVESAFGDGEKVVYESERPIIAKLRRVGASV